MKVQSIMDDIWEREDYHDWAARWMELYGVSPERCRSLSEEYKKSRPMFKT